MLVYRLMLALAAPILGLRFVWRRLRGLDAPGALAERLARGGGVPAARRLWLHGASLGELAAARALIDTALARDGALEFIVTANTETGRAAVRGWGLARVDVALAPLDYRFVLRRFLARWQPDALIVIENEIWPNRFAICAQAGVPVFLVGARMSAKSARMWRFLGLGKALGAVRWLAAQDAGSEAHLQALGVAHADTGARLLLKGGVRVGAAPGDPAGFGPGFAREATILAASTHEGEDGPILQAFARLHAENPRLRLIIAPRHPARGAAIARLCAGAGLACALRSRGAPADAPVYIADSLGEMALWYGLAGITFVGGSLVPKGGHTPFEPAHFASAIVHGPHVANNATAYGALAASGGAVAVADGDALAPALRRLIDAPDTRARMADAASAALAPLADDADAWGQFWARLAQETGNPALGTSNL